MAGPDYTPFPLVPWWERPDVAEPGRDHKVLSAGPDGSGGTSSAMLSVDQILAQLMAEDLEGLANPLTTRLAKAVDYTAEVADNGKIIAFTAASKTLTLPLVADALAEADGFMLLVSAEAGAETITRTGSDTINGSASIALAQGEIAIVVPGATAGTWRAAILLPPGVAAKTNTVNTFTKRQQLGKGSGIASATSIALPDDGNFFDVSGTAVITAISTVTPAGTRLTFRAAAAWTMQHNAVALILPRSLDLVVAVGDIVELISLGSGNYVVAGVSKADGKPLDGGALDVPFKSAQQSWVANTRISVAHLLGQQPARVSAKMICATADAGYSVGDEITLGTYWTTSGVQSGIVLGADPTSVWGVISGTYTLINKTTFGNSGITAANWKLVLEAWKQ